LVTFSVFFVGWTERPTATIDGIGQIDPTAINNSSQIIGSHVVADHFTAVLLQENRSTDLDTTTDLGTPKEFISIATGINNKGVIVGTYNSRTVDPTPHYNPRKICDVWGRNCKWIQMRGPPRYVSGPIFAFIRSDNVMRPLSEADSREVIPKSINDLGEVVGVVDSFPFIWRNGSLTVLERLSAHNYAIATAINNRDQIVGMANTAKSHDAWYSKMASSPNWSNSAAISPAFTASMMQG
jgi:uncharacterized membrane protein